MSSSIHTIVSDLDGTLVPHTTFQLSKRTKSAFLRAHEMGVRTILASGRSGASMKPYWEQIGNGYPYISSNGAQIWDASGALLSEVTMSVEMAHEALRFVKSHGMYAQTYYDTHFYYDTFNSPIADRYTFATGVSGIYVPDLFERVNAPVVKILAIADPEQVEWMRIEGGRLFENRLTFSISEPSFLEIAPLEATKGNALEILSKLLGFSREGTLAIGDSLNDESMLRWAGMSAVMSGAREGVGEHATHTCETCDNDGAAILIEKLLGI
ncbi:hydrolase [Clostridia bacterium]|nr:hydrolase [Clostridia bacterium]